jgi:hypothetical protein
VAYKFNALSYCSFLFHIGLKFLLLLISNSFVGEALVDSGFEEQNGPMPDMQNPSWSSPTEAGGRTS